MKDPAFLFYPGDWMGGTQWLTFEQKGCYMELLILQFNTGKFTEMQVKQVLSICFSNAWPVLKQKFVFEDGFYWNERLKVEIEKRKSYSESRRNNGLKPKNTPKKTKKHMLKHMEDENKDEDISNTSSFSPAFSSVWKELILMPKWKKKPQSAIDKSLAQLLKFDEQFAIELIEKAIAGNYQGVVFSNTEDEYLKWKNKNNGQTFKATTQRNKLAGNYKAMQDLAREIGS